MDLLHWSRHFRNMPGEGDLDVRAFMQAVAATGYDGPISREIFNDQFRGGSPRAIAEDGMRSLLALMHDVNRIEPASRLDVPSMPPRTEIEGVEFIEFAAHEVEANRLGSLLTTLGFAHAADHVNEDVSLWTQGEIDIVINAERKGFSHATCLSRGTGARDIGLRVKAAAETVRRAEALKVKLFHQRIDQGELHHPAIQSVGGGIMHFREGNILCDEDESGQFFQLCSLPCGDGFSFEIVERREGHGGYGAANAPHRAAAMKRLVSREPKTCALFHRLPQSELD